MTALLVAIEGIDGSGKGTQAERLVTALRYVGLRGAIIRFPRYGETHFGRTIGRYLNGEFGGLDIAGPHFAALLFAGDRFESLPLIAASQSDADVVVFDRYVASNLAHQAAKLPRDRWAAFMEWIQTVEYGVYRLPRPDLVFWLDLPVSDAVTLIARKPARQYTNRKSDLHEADVGYLENTRQAYATIAGRDAAWVRVDCRDRDGLRSIDSIHAEVLERTRAALHQHAIQKGPGK